MSESDSYPTIFSFDVLGALGIDFEPPLPANERLIEMDDEEIIELDFDSKNFYRCLRCHKTFMDFASFMFACKGHIPSFHKILYGIQRTEVIKRGGKGRKPGIKADPDTKIVKREPETEGQVQEYVCDWCGMCFGLRMSLKAHFKVHQRRLEQCQYCDGRFSRRKTLDRHVSVVHEGGDKELRSNG